jgi:hypothetical protein
LHIDANCNAIGASPYIKIRVRSGCSGFYAVLLFAVGVSDTPPLYLFTAAGLS